MATVQMNTRIDATLKSTGDLAIRSCGLTPSDAVRKIWTFAAQNRHKPEAIRKMFDALDGTDDQLAGSAESPSEIIQTAMRGPLIIERFFLDAGVDPSSLEAMSFEQVKEAAFDDELAEWTVL